MQTKRDLCSREEIGWQELVRAWERVPLDLFESPGYHPGWSVKDMVAHVGCWQAYAVQMFERIRAGTYESERLDVDAMNAEFVESMRDQPVWVAKAECFSSRTRFIQEFNALPEVTADAEEWFEECGHAHYDEHTPRLIEWADELAVGAAGGEAEAGES
jgi:hypothetical protein